MKSALGFQAMRIAGEAGVGALKTTIPSPREIIRGAGEGTIRTFRVTL